MFDWRELQRWRIREADLPVGSEVRFRQPTFWEQYRWQVVGVFGLVTAEAVLILLLTFNYVRSAPAELSLRDLPPLVPPAVAFCLYRVAQEALRNVVRHAGPTRVHVSLAGVDQGLQLVVQDDGVGFDPSLQDGCSAKEIARRLNISHRTVEFHKYHMMDSLGLRSTAQLVRWAIKRGFVSP